MTTLTRPDIDLTTLPIRMRHLRVHRGYPVPWFVEVIDGVPEFRAANAVRWRDAIRDARCWVCGERLGRHRVYVIGPMCAVNRTTSEPPCHAECAEWSAQHCPFLSRPHMVRRDATALMQQTDVEEAGGLPLLRNPGVALLWWTRVFKVFRPHIGNQTMPLIELGEPERVRWFAEGRPATRAEVVASIESGLPALREQCDREDPSQRAAAHADLDTKLRAIDALLPSEE